MAFEKTSANWVYTQEHNQYRVSVSDKGAIKIETRNNNGEFRYLACLPNADTLTVLSDVLPVAIEIASSPAAKANVKSKEMRYMEKQTAKAAHKNAQQIQAGIDGLKAMG
jgi:hypothetical protein